MAANGGAPPRSDPGGIRDELADFSADSRLLVLCGLALLLGGAGALVAKALLGLIQLITNLTYAHELTLRPLVARRGVHLSREYIVDPLELARVGEVMDARTAPAPGSADSPPSTPLVAYAEETVGAALVKLLRHGMDRLPVVRRDDPRTLVGYFGRANVVSARLAWYRNEHTRDGGGVAGPRRREGEDARPPGERSVRLTGQISAH